MYWDCLPEMDDLTGVALTLMAQHLLAGADRYALERLRLLCEAKLCEDVSINTVATTLALAEQHHCFQLKAVCLKFIALPENLKGNNTAFVLAFAKFLFNKNLTYYLLVLSPIMYVVCSSDEKAAT